MAILAPPALRTATNLAMLECLISPPAAIAICNARDLIEAELVEHEQPRL
jgi:hypothetical protein